MEIQKVYMVSYEEYYSGLHQPTMKLFYSKEKAEQYYEKVKEDVKHDDYSQPFIKTFIIN